MSDIRLEALRLAVSLNSDADKVVSTAEKFVVFLNNTPMKGEAAVQPPADNAHVAAGCEKFSEPAKEPAAESAKQPEVDIKTRVAALAKDLLKKSRPKLVEVLKDLGYEKASLIPDAKLPEAEKAFAKALAS